MRVLVSLETRYVSDSSGRVWTGMSTDYSFWKRYLSVFEEVTVMARVQTVDRVPEGWRPVDGEGVRVHALPYYIGPWQFLLNWVKLRRSIRKALLTSEALIFRVPSPIANLTYAQIKKQKRPFALEVVGDPGESIGSGALQSKFRILARNWMVTSLREQCAKAFALSYVTEFALQKRYPFNEKAFNIHASSIELSIEKLRNKALSFEEGERIERLVLVGSLENLNKAPDIAIRALKICQDKNHKFTLTLVGDGRCRPDLEALAENLGVKKQVRFLGLVPTAEAVFQVLDENQIFVLPSRAEGLPRALIEAMARAMPCVASDVGGIPELLVPEDRVPVNDARALAEKLMEVTGDTDRMRQMSERNLRKAHSYTSKRLQSRRIEFYRKLKEGTREFLLKHPKK